uniref:Uncharacterized protein n=1 Tax=uncultured prokaryote TaxID=198431 RepID=A0A0H5Q053_9ZZZZ|nr:hypothetical protein [uncultured prokaryote]
MTIDRLHIELVGGPGGNGVVTFYALDGPAAQPAVKAFADRWHNILPNDVILNVPNVGDTIDEETGDLVDVWTGGTVGGFTGADAGSWAAGVGMRINWRTAGIVRSRRVQGRTFLVPIGAGCFENNGLPKALYVDGIGDWASELVSATPGNLVVWSRPVGDSFGSAHPIVSLSVPVESTMLRTRRT